MSILVFNVGSSTLKFAVFDDMANNELAMGKIDWRGGTPLAQLEYRSKTGVVQQATRHLQDKNDAVRWVYDVLKDDHAHESIRFVGHRVVHGGTEFRQPTRIDNHVFERLKRVAPLAPLHNPAALEVITSARSFFCSAEHVAVFDTAFFTDLPQHRFFYPVPYEWYENFGIRRFGFHGISHAYSASQAAKMLNRPSGDSSRLVICHLGNGCSATAVCNGKAIATTMGFTPLEGLMMGTRSGSIDPGMMLYMLREQRLSTDELDAQLNNRSGLLGVSGVSSDFREIEKAAEAGNARARLAIDMFADRVRSTIGALIATLGGLDALVFTAGIGEHAAKLRQQVCSTLGFLGINLSDDRNRIAIADCDVSDPDSPVRVLVITAREELMIAGAIS